MTPFPQRQITQGDTLSWRVDLPAYPASTWALSYVWKTAGADPVTVTATAEGDSHLVDQATEAWTAGQYAVVAYATHRTTGARKTLGRMDLVVQVDLATVDASYDPRTQNEIILAQIDAALAACTSDAVQSYTIGGRTVTKDKSGLMRLRRIYAAAVRREKGLSGGRIITPGMWRR